MYGLVDCNNFYASCERIFRPELIGKPIIVLSNNDGCVIARSNETKALGIKMGVPAYQIKELVERYDIRVFSSNYTLYGDMSARVMQLLSSATPEIEVYSIDEAFLNFSGIEYLNLEEYGREITKKVTKGTGIPVSLGIAPTKTLAKVANKFAKRYPQYKNTCVIDTEEKRIKALQLTEVGDVWGIGRQHTKRLNMQGIFTAYDFSQLPKSLVHKKMSVVGERTWQELHGISCIDMELIETPKKQICTSRSFGKMVTGIDLLSESVATYASLCAEKLRKQKSCAAAIMVFIHTNNFRKDLPQFFKNEVITLPVPTNSTIEIVKYALQALSKIYRDGFQYKKAGVIINEIVPENCIQSNLFVTVDHDKHARLMNVLDKVNSGYAKNSISLGVQGTTKSWSLKQEMLSPCYTTKLKDIITVH